MTSSTLPPPNHHPEQDWAWVQSLMLSKMVVVTIVKISFPLSQLAIDDHYLFPQHSSWHAPIPSWLSNLSLSVCHIVRIVTTEQSYYVAISSPFLTFNIVLGMPPVPHAVQVAEFKALHLSKVDLRQ